MPPPNPRSAAALRRAGFVHAGLAVAAASTLALPIYPALAAPLVTLLVLALLVDAVAVIEREYRARRRETRWIHTDVVPRLPFDHREAIGLETEAFTRCARRWRSARHVRNVALLAVVAAGIGGLTAGDSDVRMRWMLLQLALLGAHVAQSLHTRRCTLELFEQEHRLSARLAAAAPGARVA